MSDPRLTGERLSNHLDANQAARERLCLALLPFLGAPGVFTNAKGRRPRGGADQGRDIEAVYRGTTPCWGAVGFRNGGGDHSEARRETCKKFDEDLTRALEEYPALQVFVFFTNVDLTTEMSAQLKAAAIKRGIKFVDIFDFERLLAVLNSAEGLLARLQYLGIPMSESEQLSLINRFGTELQNAVSSRFDRVERTLGELREFLDFQKPIHRIDVSMRLKQSANSREIGNEALLLDLDGLIEPQNHVMVLCANAFDHPNSNQHLITRPFLWLTSNKHISQAGYSFSSDDHRLLESFLELRLTRSMGQPVRLSDTLSVVLNLHVTEPLLLYLQQVSICLNGYEIFKIDVGSQASPVAIELPKGVQFDAADKHWLTIMPSLSRHLAYDKPRRVQQFQELRSLD